MNCPNCGVNNTDYLYKFTEFKTSDYDLRCTSLNYTKPNLIKCADCKLIYSELYKIDFEKLYGDVIDHQYIELIPYKKLYFTNTLKKIQKYLDKDKDVLEIGSYYGVFGSLVAPETKTLLEKDFKFEAQEAVELKGFNGPVVPFQYVDLKKTISPEVLEGDVVDIILKQPDDIESILYV